MARRGGIVAGIACKDLEAETGESVITSQNAVRLNAVVTDVMEAVAQAEGSDTDKK